MTQPLQFTVKHWLPGRLRLHVPALAMSGLAGEKVVAWLAARDEIKSVRINHGNANLIIEYDETRRPMIVMMMAWLRGVTVRQLVAMATRAMPDAGAVPAAAGPDAAASRLPPPVLGPSVLALPTVSFALAFCPGAWAVGINVPLMLWNGWPIARRAFRILWRERRLNVDFLDTLAIGASILQGLYVTGSLITWLIRLGDWIRDLTAAGSKRAISGLMEFQNRTAWLLVDGSVVSVPSSKLAEGDLVVVYPGEMIPVDGEVIDGEAMIDQKTITGEGLPVARAKGQAVFAATALREGQITIRAARVGAGTIAGQIAMLVDNAPIGDTRMQNHAERFADRLVAPTVALAAGSAMLTADYRRFLSLVIVDFGTGIRVAAPTSVLASMTHAARNGIVIKSGGHMEKLAHVDTVVFDKTGTLTHGVPEVIDVITFQKHLSADRVLGLAVGAESRLRHPVAEALRARAAAHQVSVPLCDTPDYKVGLGVQGEVDGHYVHIGSERFLRGGDIHIGKHAVTERAGLDERGYSCLYMAVDGKLAGMIPYADKIRPESRDVIRRLHDMGVRDTIMLTGDNATVARAVGKRIGLTRQYADMMPSGKADVIAELKAEGRTVAMVGDGINDSVALTYSDVGIAMRHGAEITHESAHVVLMEDSLWKLVQAIEISRGAVSLIKQNYAIVGLLNGIALGLALPGGLVSPAFTAILSNGSAILASMNGVRPLLRG